MLFAFIPILQRNLQPIIITLITGLSKGANSEESNKNFFHYLQNASNVSVSGFGGNQILDKIMLIIVVPLDTLIVILFEGVGLKEGK